MTTPTTRRDFLARSTAVAAGLMVHSSSPVRAGDSPNDKIQLGLIGCGGVMHGHVHRLHNYIANKQMQC